MDTLASSSQQQFDSLLGGTENVPSEVNILEFAAARKEEILMLTEAIKESPFKGQAFQRLPKHMRRRQMSHHLKRLPRTCRHTHISLLKNKDAKVSKRPSRKYRRRPGNLLQEYNRRQRNGTWLETHIWHAKRFHMVKKWGYKLASSPVNKGFRANYRAAAAHCLLLDHSYYSCVQLSGGEELLQGLQQCVSTECGLTFAAKAYANGSREGTVSLFHPGKYPFGFIGTVRFLWRSSAVKERTIWIFVHPAVHDEVTDCFKMLFNLQTCDGFTRTPKFSNSSVTMVLLKDTLNRFRLVGPLSQAVVADVFQVISVSSEPVAKKPKLDVEVVEEESWWECYYDSQALRDWGRQCEFYSGLRQFADPSQLPPGIVLSVVVADPRFRIPGKRTKSVLSELDCSDTGLVTVDPSLCKSPLWESSVRDEVSETKLSTAKVNTARAALIVPGQTIAPNGGPVCGKPQSRVPLLLIQRPGLQCKNDGKLGFGSGWDIIAPAGWALPTWRALVMRGSRTGGLRETETLAFESGSLRDILQPDCRAGQTEAAAREEALRARHFRLPPKKRANYNKLAAVSPFNCPWLLLIRDWVQFTTSQAHVQDFYVLRNRTRLQELQDLLRPRRTKQTIEVLPHEQNALVPVTIHSLTKGTPQDFAMICLPTRQSYETWRNEKKAPTETVHIDAKQIERKELRTTHKATLKTLKRKRRKTNLKLKDKIKAQPLDKKVVSRKREKLQDWTEYHAQMKDLWLKSSEKLETVINSAGFLILGFVVKGGFAFSKAGGFAMGYISLLALKRLHEQAPKHNGDALVLLRNPNQSSYRFAKLRISTL